MSYLTKENINVSERISSGKTILVKGISDASRQQAQKIAIKMNSYIYDVYQDTKKGIIHVGYGIPK